MGERMNDTMRKGSPDDEGRRTMVMMAAGLQLKKSLLPTHQLLIQSRRAFRRAGYGGPKSTKNPSKIGPKSDQKEDAILNATWKALGPIFDGFWLQNGGVWEVLGP